MCFGKCQFQSASFRGITSVTWKNPCKILLSYFQGCRSCKIVPRESYFISLYFHRIRDFRLLRWQNYLRFSQISRSIIIYQISRKAEVFHTSLDDKVHSSSAYLDSHKIDNLDGVEVFLQKVEQKCVDQANISSQRRICYKVALFELNYVSNNSCTENHCNLCNTIQN